MLHCMLCHLDDPPRAHPAEAHQASTGIARASAMRQLCVLCTAADKACMCTACVSRPSGMSKANLVSTGTARPAQCASCASAHLLLKGPACQRFKHVAS